MNSNSDFFFHHSDGPVMLINISKKIKQSILNNEIEPNWSEKNYHGFEQNIWMSQSIDWNTILNTQFPPDD